MRDLRRWGEVEAPPRRRGGGRSLRWERGAKRRRSPRTCLDISGAPSRVAGTVPVERDPAWTPAARPRRRSPDIGDLCRRLPRHACMTGHPGRGPPLTTRTGARDRPPRSGPDRLHSRHGSRMGAPPGTGSSRPPGPAASWKDHPPAANNRVRRTASGAGPSP